MSETDQVRLDVPVASRFRSVAESMPDECAIVASHARYTYREIDQWSDAIASDIAASATPQEVPVAIVMCEPVAVVPAALAVVKAGHFFVMIDGLEPEERIRSLLDTAGVSLCVVDSAVYVATSERRVIEVGPCRRASVATTDAPPNDLLHLTFTSGTTGVPKAIATRQQGYVRRFVSAAKRMGREPGERSSYTALPGSARSAGETFGTLLNGATLCSFDARTERIEALAELIERERISTLSLTPVLFRHFMRTLSPSADLSSVQRLRLVADVATLADVEAWRARFPASSTFERFYAATETGLVLHMSITHDTPVPGPLVPMGRPGPRVDVRVVDEDDNDVADGETGELIVRSPYVARGYWNAPELTAERFTFDPERPETSTFRTGDLVRRDEDGLYYFVGRRDSRLRIHGRRIDPVEVESALVAHAGLREAVVVEERDANGEGRLAAWVVAGDATPIPREIRAALRGRIPVWMIPSRIHTIDALPVTRGGKIDRDALAGRSTTIGDDASPDTAESAGLEETLLAIWARVLGNTMRVEPDDDFFDDLGGTSVDALEIVTEIERVTGRSIPLSLLLELNTVRKLSDYLAVRPDMDRTVIALQRRGSRPPLFCVSGKGGSVIAFRALAEALGSDQPFYGLTHHGIDSHSLPTTLAAFAACYVDSIREQQPEGPYYLAGYSGGGFVAYEVGRQLARAGKEVAFVGVFDAVIGGEPLPWWKRYGKYVSMIRRRPAASLVRYARALLRRVEWAGLWVRGGGRKPFVPQLEANQFYDSLRMTDALQPWAGPVTLFLARQGRGADVAGRDAGWGAMCGDALKVVEIEGSHDTILDLDVAELAAALSQALAETREGRS